MSNNLSRRQIIKVAGKFVALTGFSFAMSFTALLAPLLPAHSALRKLYEYDLAVVAPTRWLKASPSQAFQELRRCFNCSFPVAGAPLAYPTSGKFIPLTACVAGAFGCRAAPVKAYPRDSQDRLVLIAQPGHFDGADSSVTFRFYKDNRGYLNLKVTAYVTNPAVPDELNKAGALVTWNKFAAQLGNNMWNNTCAQGKVCGL